MISIEAKNEVIRKIKDFEEVTSTEVSFKFEKYIFEIIEPLFAADGYSLLFKNGIDNNQISFLATHESDSETIGLVYKHRNPYNSAIPFRTINEIIGNGVEFALDRIIILTDSNFSPRARNFINYHNPIKLDRLRLNDLKNWVFRLEAESDLVKLDYENIIKTVSNEFIKRIAYDPNYLLKLEWRELERTIADIFHGLAFKVFLTPPSKDGGKDIILECYHEGNKKTYIVEIKHWRSKQRVGKESIKDFIQVICNEKRDSGLFLSTYGFTENAFEGISEIERKKIKYGDKNKIISLCQTYLKVRSGIWRPLNNMHELLFEETK